MTQEKIWKVVKGLAEFSLDEVMMITGCSEDQITEVIKPLLDSKTLIKLADDRYSLIKESIFKKKSDQTRRKVIRISTKKFKNFSIEYLETQLLNKCSPTTLTSYENILKKHLIPFFGEYRSSEITIDKIERFKEEKIAEGLSNKTINNCLIFLGSLLEYANKNNGQFVNPLSRVKRLKVNRDRQYILTKEEMEKLLSVAQSFYQDFYPLLYTAIHTDLGKNELLGLTWDKIDFEKRTILVDQKAYKRQLIPIISKKKVREIKITDDLAKVLQDWKEACPAGVLNLVFPNRVGDFQDPDNMTKRRFNPLVEKAGLKHIQFKDLSG